MLNLKDYIPALRHGARLPLQNLQGAGILSFGDIYYVDSVNGSDTANSGTEPDDALATIDAGVNKCTADNGDVIFVLPGHSEASTASIAMDVAGVSVIGLGVGSKRPVVTSGNATAAVIMSAAGCRLSNIQFALGTVAATVAAAVNITADGCIVDNCETHVHATSQFTSHITATDAQYVKIMYNRILSLGAAGSTAGITLDGCDDIEVVGNFIHGHFGEHAVDNTSPGSADEVLRANISNNYIANVSVTAGDLAIELDGSATGFFAHNMLVSGLATIAAGFDIGDLASMESYIADDGGVDVHGLQLGTAAA